MLASVVALHSLRPVRDAPPPARVSDEELVRRLRRGDSWAKEAFYRRYFDAVFGAALRLLGSRVDAEDVLQDTFASALEQIGTLRDPTKVGPWLLQITVRLVHRRFRRRRLLRALGLDRGSDDATLELLADSGMPAEARAELAILDGVLARQPAAYRIAWMLRFVEGHSLDEVAIACNVSLATAKRYIDAAQHVIRQHLEIREDADV